MVAHSEASREHFVQTLDADDRNVLDHCEGSGGALILAGVRSLIESEAKLIAGFPGECVYLNHLESLDATTAEALAGFRGTKLSLNGLTSLDAASAKALAGFEGPWLHLNGLTGLDVASAQGLAGFRGPTKDLYLNGLTSLDAASAKAPQLHVHRSFRIAFDAVPIFQQIDVYIQRARLKEGLLCPVGHRWLDFRGHLDSVPALLPSCRRTSAAGWG
jgi:hypothetical protein